MNERKRLECIMIKVSKEEKERIADAAYRAGMTMSAYIRALLVKAANGGS